MVGANRRYWVNFDCVRQLPKLRGGAVGVGDVVGREVRIGDRRHPVELVGEGDLPVFGGEVCRLLCREVIRVVVGEGGLPGVRAVERGAAAEQV